VTGVTFWRFSANREPGDPVDNDRLPGLADPASMHCGVDAFTAKQTIQTSRSLQGRGTTREAHILVFPRGIDGLVGTGWHGNYSWKPGGPGGGKP